MLDQAVDYRVELLQKQDDFIFSTQKYPAFIAGLGSGKTWAGCLRGLLKCAPGQDGVIIAPTYPMIRDVTQKTFLNILDSGNQSFDFNKTEGLLKYRGASILFRSADIPERLRGINVNWAYLDEAALMREAIWKVILGRIRIGDNPSAWITTTPAGFNWVYRYWVEQQNKNYQIIHASTRDNIYLPEEYLQDLEANYSGEYAKQEIDGDFVAFEGLVYSEFSHHVHILDPFSPPEDWQRVRGIDFGYTNPFVCLWGAIDPDGRLYIYDEHYLRRALIVTHAEAIHSREGDFIWTVSDHDAQDNAELRAQEIYTINAKKEVIAGIQKVKARLKVQGDWKPRLFITSNCVNTIKEAGMYRWAESKSGRNDKEEPIKESDHCMDPIRYMVMQLDPGGGYISTQTTKRKPITAGYRDRKF